MKAGGRFQFAGWRLSESLILKMLFEEGQDKAQRGWDGSIGKGQQAAGLAWEGRGPSLWPLKNCADAQKKSGAFKASRREVPPSLFSPSQDKQLDSVQ